MGALQKPRKPGSLKQACALLVERCGGQKAVAAIWGCSAQNVARMTDSDSAQNPPRIDQILVAEAICKQPIVTTFLAAELNCIVEPVALSEHQSIPMVVGRCTKEFAELLTAAALAVQHGQLTPVSAAALLRETDDVVGAMFSLRAEARAVLRGDCQ